METLTIQLPPFSIRVDDCEARVLEIYKTQLINGEIWYHVVVELVYKGIRSKRYTLDVKDTNQLINKLKMEVTKVKFLEYAYGLNEVRRAISG